MVAAGVREQRLGFSIRLNTVKIKRCVCMCEDCLCNPAAGLMSVFLLWWSRCFSSLPCPCLRGVYAVKSYTERCSYLLFKAPFVCLPSFSGTSLHQGSGRYGHITNVGSGRTHFPIGNSDFGFSGKHLKVIALPIACMFHGFLCDQSAQRKWKLRTHNP